MLNAIHTAHLSEAGTVPDVGLHQMQMQPDGRATCTCGGWRSCILVEQYPGEKLAEYDRHVIYANRTAHGYRAKPRKGWRVTAAQYRAGQK
jgi:hypothetical protein